MKRRDLVWYSLLFVAGCTVAIDRPNAGSKNSSSSHPETLRFAVTDVNGMEELKRDYEPFRAALEEVLEKKIEFFATENYLTAASALQVDRVDLVLAGPSEYVVIHARAKAVPVVALTRPNFHSIVVVRADSGIESLADLKGKKIAISSIGSTSSHIGASKLFVEAGMNPVSDFEMVPMGKTGWQGLQDGRVDAWAVFPHRYQKFLDAEGFSESDFPVIARGEPLPNDVFVANRLLDPAFIEEIQSRTIENQEKLIAALLATEANQKLKGGTLVPAKDSDYNMVREIYQIIGQDDYL